jgi:hypothetical protein
MKLHDGPRCLRAIDPARPDPVEPAEWWLAVGVKHSSA